MFKKCMSLITLFAFIFMSVFPSYAVLSPFDVDYNSTGEVYGDAIQGGLPDAEAIASARFSDIKSACDSNLTEEEAELIAKKLLPPYYPVLKQCKERRPPFDRRNGGLRASIELCKSFYPDISPRHFSKDFGNMDKMLAWAKKAAEDEKFTEMIQNCERGDVFLAGPKKQASIDNNMICMMTNGPYFHATLVVSVYPPVVIEAMGITAGTASDPTKDQVRITMWYEELAFWKKLRMLRPTEDLSDAEAKAVIDKAIAYAKRQLGKPYDYSFTNADNDRAFYCSELVSKAYRHAGMEISEKSPERDRLVVAFHEAVDGLKPKDKFLLSDQIVQFTMDYMENPDFNKLQKFLVHTVVPGCAVFDKAFPDEAALNRLDRTVDMIKTGKAFNNFKKAQKDYNKAKDSGKFKTFLIGPAKQAAAKLKIANAVRKDVNILARAAGVSKREFLKIAFKLFVPLYKHLGAVGDLVGGLARQQKKELPEGLETVMEIIDWATQKREIVKEWPLIGKPLARIMPGNAEGRIREDFTSPSDLSRASKKIVYDWP